MATTKESSSSSSSSTSTLQLGTIVFRPVLQPDPDIPPPAFDELCAQLRAVPGVATFHRGRQAERPDTWTLAVRWASGDALDAFLASPAFPGWLAGLRAVADSFLVYRATLRGHPAAALEAPCTEVFSVFGASENFLDQRLDPFVTEINAGRLPGHHGSAHGSIEAHMQHGSLTSPEGVSVVAILGWESKEAHLAQRGQDKLIDQHIHYVREDRKSAILHFVSFTSL